MLLGVCVLQATYRPFLRQILEEVFHPDRLECPDIEHTSGGLTDLLKTGFSMFMKVSLSSQTPFAVLHAMESDLSHPLSSALANSLLWTIKSLLPLHEHDLIWQFAENTSRVYTYTVFTQAGKLNHQMHHYLTCIYPPLSVLCNHICSALGHKDG